MPGTQQDIHIAVRPEDFFSVITDYEHYPEFLDEMEAVKLLSRIGDTAEVQFSVNLIKRITYTLILTENEPLSLTWKLKEGPFKISNGSWTLKRTADGHTHAHYAIEVKVAAFVPKSISSRIVGTTVPALLNAFKARAETLHSS